MLRTDHYGQFSDGFKETPVTAPWLAGDQDCTLIIYQTVSEKTVTN